MPASPVHHTPVDKTTPWDGGAAEKAFDKKAGDFVKFYAWVDEGESDADADGTDKEDGWGPHHDVGSDGVPGDANLAGVHAAVAALNGAHGGNSKVPDNDRAATFKHLVAHLRDAGVKEADLPELKSAEPRRKPRQRRELQIAPEWRRFTLRVQTQGLELRDATGVGGQSLVEVSGQVIVYDTSYQVNDMWGSFNETIHYGAATPVLARDDLDVRFLFNHNGMPLDRSSATLRLTDDPSSLNVAALIDPRMSLGSDLLIAIERGLITQMSVGMEVDPAGDVWSGEDDWGMPNVRDIYRLANVFDVSAVTFPASPTTSIQLAQRMWNEVPVESRARTRQLWAMARDARAGRLTPAESDTLMHALERMAQVDAGEMRADPTAADADIADKITAAKKAVADALAAQAKDPDNNSDPTDKKVLSALQNAETALSTAMAAQQKDGAPDAEAPETKSDDGTSADGSDGNSDGVQGDADGTAASGASNAPGVGSDDGTGSRSMQIELDLLRLRRRPI